MIATEPRRMRRALTTAALSLLVLPLGACTFHGTDTIYTPAQGVTERSGQVDVLNAMIVSSESGEGRLIAGLANNDAEQGDALVAVRGIDEDSAVEARLEGGPIEIEPEGYVQIADIGASVEGPQILLQGEDVVAGEFIRLSIEFERSEPVDIHVIVVEPGEDLGPFSTATPPASPSEFPSTAPLEEDVAE